MAVSAYVFINTKVGKARSVAERLSKIQGCKGVCNVTGRFDVILMVEAQDTKALGDLIVTQIHNIDGVEKTETAVIV